MLVQQAVILCGGKGTRLAERGAELPKPMILLDGRPVLDHIISNLRKRVSGGSCLPPVIVARLWPSITQRPVILIVGSRL